MYLDAMNRNRLSEDLYCIIATSESVNAPTSPILGVAKAGLAAPKFEPSSMGYSGSDAGVL